jgi:hypothetical protein
MSKGKKIEALVAQRNKLIAEYAANKRARIKLECDLDRLRCRIGWRFVVAAIAAVR